MRTFDSSNDSSKMEKYSCCSNVVPTGLSFDVSISMGLGTYSDRGVEDLATLGLPQRSPLCLLDDDSAS